MEKKVNLTKGIYLKKPQFNTILNGDIVNAFFLRLGTREGWGSPLLQLLLDILLKVLIDAKKPEKETKGIHIEKEEVKLSSFIDIINYMGNQREFTKSY